MSGRVETFELLAASVARSHGPSSAAFIRAAAARIAALEEIIYLYVDPFDVRPEHQSTVDEAASRAALEPKP